jgi:hypothetical protein
MTSGRATEVNATAAGLDTRIVAHGFNLRQPSTNRGDPRILPTPAFPTSGSRADELLHLFHAGRDGIVHPEFMYETGSWRLADPVWKLRGLGWAIETRTINSRRVGAYCLDPAHRLLLTSRWGRS